jgi:uncharacterized protein (TIGR00297 family)
LLVIGYAQDSIVNQRLPGVTVDTWTKAIPESRDRGQSRALVWVVGPLLVAACLPMVVLSMHPQNAGYWALRAGIVSLTFAAVVWVLRAATPLAASFGGMICFLVTIGTERLVRLAEMNSALMALMTLFVLTFLAGKLGRSRTIASAIKMTDTMEERRGRSASQVLANLGAAGLLSAAGLYSLLDKFAPRRELLSPSVLLVRVALLGCLAEATADTVSSEIGAAFGGRPFLLTTFRRVDPGTDGAVSLTGTLAGSIAAALVVTVGIWSMGLTLREGLAAFLGGVAGLIFDSFLGATVERRGWIGNDWVNFLSTIVGGAVAWALATV